MNKLLKYVGILVGSLVVLICACILYLGIYPELSAIRKQCNKVEVGMTRNEANAIMRDLLNRALDRAVVDEKQIFLQNNGVDCSIDFDNEGKVIKVTSAVDAF
jgi:hypothetical protein